MELLRFVHLFVPKMSLHGKVSFNQVAPTIFTQVFTVLGNVRRNRPYVEAEPEYVTLPLAYALLSGKASEQYYDVFHALDEAADGYGIRNFTPTKIMGDFELAIIKACNDQFYEAEYSGCFFHFCQIIYRKIQEDGLQVAYADPNNRSIKQFSHMIMALAFVPEQDVKLVFRKLKDAIPEELKEVAKFFGKNYVIGTPARRLRTGRVSAALPPRYPPKLWNQYYAALNNEQKTNNVSEGWHNRFRLVVGKHHPDLYSFLRELQKEQADTEIAVIELGLGRSVKAAPKKKWKDAQARICGIAREYQNYKDNEMFLEYIENLAYNIHI